ncbi:hypothetical protein K7X08_023805 [Anisodus acutangulus]|uniref:Uncharacterized protein n=1 Tax=Anisodus acutangulus TaxID=402998 RepID=A0A9Q1LBP1_9SOLA|nr:hypothetical protein K7X08_023805 [Anisodus acutangulus]
MARKRAIPAFTQPIPPPVQPLAPPTTQNSRVATPETGIPQALASFQLNQWLTGATQVSKVQQALTKVATQRDSTVVKTPNPGPENDTKAAQATRKLTFSADSSAIEPVVPRKNNRAPKRGKQLFYFSPVLRDGQKIVKLNMEEVPKGVGDPKGKKKQLPQPQWQARPVSNTTQLEQPREEIKDTGQVVKENAVQLVEKQLRSLGFIEDSIGLKGPEQPLLNPT